METSAGATEGGHVQTWHAVRLAAAEHMLRHWQAGGARSVRLELHEGAERVWPDVVDFNAGWPPEAPEAAAAVVATVLLGVTYPGWEESLRVVMSGVEAMA